MPATLAPSGSGPAASCWPPARPVRKRAAPAPDALTPQDIQVARLAAEGHTNPEIGAQLFVSPRTAEHHLGKVCSRSSGSPHAASSATLGPDTNGRPRPVDEDEKAPCSGGLVRGLVFGWAVRDSNPRPLARHASALAN